MKLEFSRNILEKKYSNIKFKSNPSSGSRAVPCGQTDGRTDKTKVTVAWNITCHVKRALEQNLRRSLSNVLQLSATKFHSCKGMWETAVWQDRVLKQRAAALWQPTSPFSSVFIMICCKLQLSHT